MGVMMSRKKVGCSNCRGVYIKGVTDNCKSCRALFKQLIHDPIMLEYGLKYNMKFVRNHVIVYNNDQYNARLAIKIIIDHLGFRNFERGSYIKRGNYAIKLIKSATSSNSIIDDQIGDNAYWFGVSFRIIPWAEITCDVRSE
ncbi:hypothetical protein F-E9_302 [Faustovirus]|nr:hypothetical protein F-E9_302 [Faustovirus]